MASAMLTCLYFLLWIYLTVAEKEVYVRLHQNSESRKCQLPDEIGFTIDEHQPRSHQLRLTRNDDINVNIPVYSVTHEDGIPRYKSEYYKHQQDSAMYHDIQNGASMLIRCVNRINGTDWYWMMDGHVYIDSTNHRLEPVLENGEIRRHNDQHVYQLSPIEERHSCDFNSDETKPQPPLFQSPTSRRKRAISTPIKVDVAIFVDYNAYKLWLARENNDVTKATEVIRIYFTHVIAGVNVRFQTMKPGLDISIIPISVTIFKSATSWTDDISVSMDGTLQVDAVKVLEELKTWITDTKFTAYDHVMAFTGYDLFSSGNEQFTTGLANIGKLCKQDGSSTSIVEDSGGFQSIVTASHELGHGMNGEHDGADNACKDSDRYIMSPRSDFAETPQTILNPWKFSTCSVSQFETFFNTILSDSSMATCLNDKLPTTDIPDISGEIAGQVYGPDEQCRHIHGAESYVCRGQSFGTGGDVCRKMFCAKTASGSGTDDCESITPAEGTSCGNKQWCFLGQCIYSEKAPTREGNCIYGDQDGVITNGNDCAYVRTTFNGYCYPEHEAYTQRCCETCERIKTDNPVCEYGDKVSGCTVEKCGKLQTNDNQLFDINCCGTCNYTGKVIDTTPTPTPTQTTDVTTPPSCADVPLINDKSCPDYIASIGDKQCYNSQSETYCCATCSAKRRNNPGCQYGDRNPQCSLQFCGSSLTNGKKYSDVCCETCAARQITSGGTTLSKTTGSPIENGNPIVNTRNSASHFNITSLVVYIVLSVVNIQRNLVLW